MKAGLVVGALVASGAVAAVAVAELQHRDPAPPASRIRPTTVLPADGKVSNWGSVVADGWFAWIHGNSAPGNPALSHTDVFVRHGHESAWRANPAGTYAQTGGISDGKLMIQLLHRSSLLATVDLRTRKLRVLPAPINDPSVVQWRPSVSNHRVLYGRAGNLNFQIMLADLDTRRVIELADVRGHAAYAEPGQLSGRYATWIACPDNHCRVFRYDIVTGVRVEMPPVGGVQYNQFAPSVTGDGTVYFGISMSNCADARLMRWRSGEIRTVYQFPPGQSFDYSYAATTQPAAIYFDEGKCTYTAPTRIEVIRDTVG